ncbi:hypothetical protein IMSAGC011_01420 [Lachnospiraceae bacterium]|nr:hypothetical protein IMSAGC011_01420 [Lachnospiraceae bacterium]
MYKYGIVVIGYKNEAGVVRLLNALGKADYENEYIPLIISIDKSDDNNVIKEAQNFYWDFGDKHIMTFPKQMGLRNHVLHCGDYLNDYNLDAIVVFEDDMMPSRNFFSFVKACTEKYIEIDNIAGISLYTHCINFTTGDRFIPITCDGDNYFFQCPQSRGQVWFKKQWNEFREWYKSQGKLESEYLIPSAVTSWPDTSWLKYHIKYCIEKNKYFVYPYISYSTCFGDVGEHVKVQNNMLHVPLSNKHSKSFELIEFNGNALKYDAFFENQSLYRYCDVHKNDLLVDLYCDHTATNRRYLLTKKNLPYRVKGSWGGNMIPHELNIVYDIPGNDIFLYDLNNDGKLVYLPKKEVKKDKMECYFDILDRWMQMEESGHYIYEYFINNNWEHIAIYGKGKLGMHLYNKLKSTQVNVDYFIDKNTEGCKDDIKVIYPHDKIPEVDAVVITPVMEYETIKDILKNGGIKNVISMDSIISNDVGGI